MVPSDRIQGNRQELKHRKFHLNMRENFCTLREGEPWNRLPREAVGSYFSGDFQNLTGHHPVQPAVVEHALAG